MDTFALARIYEAAGYKEYACRAAACATWLQYNATATGERQLQAANFCQLRLCPLCTARRAKKAAYKLSGVMDAVEREHPGCSYLFLTLTIRNVEGPDLGRALTALTSGWERLRKQRAVDRALSGWFRAIEITRKGAGYHPHIHAIVAVMPEYFRRSSGLYIKQADWVERWRAALRVDYDPSVRISKTTADKGGRAASLEAAKYATKSSDYIDPALSLDEAVEIVTDYTVALHRRRLTAYGGWMKDAARALDADNLDEDADLVHTEDESIRADVAELIEDYHWSFGAGDYVLSDRRINPLRVER